MKIANKLPQVKRVLVKYKKLGGELPPRSFWLESAKDLQLVKVRVGYLGLCFAVEENTHAEDIIGLLQTIFRPKHRAARKFPYWFPLDEKHHKIRVQILKLIARATKEIANANRTNAKS